MGMSIWTAFQVHMSSVAKQVEAMSQVPRVLGLERQDGAGNAVEFIRDSSRWWYARYANVQQGGQSVILPRLQIRLRFWVLIYVSCVCGKCRNG